MQLTLTVWLGKVFTSNQMHHGRFTSRQAKTYNASVDNRYVIKRQIRNSTYRPVNKCI